MSYTSAENDIAWRHWRREWSLPPDVIYLNHGSFGPAAREVQNARQSWTDQLEAQPFDFFVRQMESELMHAAEYLGEFVGTSANNLAFVDNATTGMNIVAKSLKLKPGDEVLTTNHAYGAVLRIWRTICKLAGAKLIVHTLPDPLTDTTDLVDSLFTAVTDNTRLLVVDHIASPTAVIFPVAEICRRAQQRGVPVCIDGPHAFAMLPLNLDALGCDYYMASGHKWLAAPFGSGFLYAHPRVQKHLEPLVISWGGSLAGAEARWQDEFHWPGTRDAAAQLTIPSAIDFLCRAGVSNFRRRSHDLAQYARFRIAEVTGLPPDLPDSPAWYGSMISLPLPPGDEPPLKKGVRDPLQGLLWKKYHIEVPVIHWHGRRLLRVSCHLYTSARDIDALADALRDAL